MNEGLLILRIAVATILFMHATQKLLGWFQGSGLDGATKTFTGLGQMPARQMVLLASGCELTCASSVGFGLVTFGGAAVGVGVMLVAGGSMTLRAGRIWASAGGGEYPLVLAVLFVVIGFTGPGRYSLDNAFGAPWYGGVHVASYWIGIGVLVVSVVGALPPLTKSRSTLRSRAELERSARG
jgi:putative oxidoreductase